MQALPGKFTASDYVCLEIQLIVHNNGEHRVTLINPVSAKHSTRPNFTDRRQLFDYKINEFTLSGHDGKLKRPLI